MELTGYSDFLEKSIDKQLYAFSIDELKQSLVQIPKKMMITK